MLDQLFNDGIAHEEQWTFPSKNVTHRLERKQMLDHLQERFSKNVALIHQLPPEDTDSLRAAFYNVTENWFHQVFESEGYDPHMCAKTLNMWLRGEINALVLCGTNLSNAKLMFNVLAQCFPYAIVDDRINSISSLHRCSSKASLYCVPFVDVPPTPAMLHLMEGNSAVCVIGNEPQYVPSTQMLIHCCDLALAQAFIASNVSVFFLTADQSKSPKCYNPRVELRDYVHSCSHDFCLLNLHCKKNNPLCSVCINKTA